MGLTEMQIKKSALYWVRTPLHVPYENALNRIVALDAILVRLQDEHGNIGWGEACPVKGYSPESPDEAWDYAVTKLASLHETTPCSSTFASEDEFQRYPFMVSAFFEAIDDLSLAEPDATDKDISVPVIGIVNSLDVYEVRHIARELVADGHTTLKLKVGYDVKKDIDRVASVLAAVPESVSVRIDANQGYTRDEAIAFVTALKNARQIEVFEQPVPAHQWDDIGAIASTGMLPIMLDESIYDEADIHRAASLPGVVAVKLKMSKSGGPKGLQKHIAIAREHELSVVIGNGIASDIGCYYEARIQHEQQLELAGEMNGFDKIVARFTHTGMRIKQGMLLMNAGRRQINEDQIQQYLYKQYSPYLQEAS